MSFITRHIDNQSKVLLNIPEKLSILSFVTNTLSIKWLVKWYINKLDLIRIEIIGFVALIKKREIPIDSKSHYFFQKLFRIVYSFQLDLEKDNDANLYELKLSVSKLSDSLKEMLLIHERLLLGDDDDILMDSSKDDYSDWTVEKSRNILS